MPEHPNLYATFHDVLDHNVCVLKNDLGQKFIVTREAAGDVALMLAEWCDDPDLCRFVAEQWQGRADVIEMDDEEELLEEEEEPDLDEEADESMVDLGGGMVVPLSELMEDDD